MLDIQTRIAAPGEHQRGLEQHLAPVMNRTPLALPPHRPRQRCAEAANHVSSDARGISRYESGRITASLDTLVRIAEVFNVSLDYLAVDDTPRRPFHVDDPGLTEHLAQAHELAGDDRASLLNVLDALLTKTRVKAVISSGEAS